MDTIDQKQTKIIFHASTEMDNYRYNSSGRLKRPVVFNKRRNPLSYVVDWQMDESDENLLE